MLFTDFLPAGYQLTTLSCVAADYYHDAILAKLHLGMLITLLDDFADNPRVHNSRLLYELYKIPFNINCSNRHALNEQECTVFDLTCYLADKILEHIRHLPGYKKLLPVVQFDLNDIYRANQYSALITQQAVMLNSYELTHIRPFNMGMVMAGVIDLMASPGFDYQELGSMRYVLHRGQRYGSISNNITTFQRELAEGDVTNEIIIKGIERNLLNLTEMKSMSADMVLSLLEPVMQEMILEQSIILNEISSLKENIHSLNVAYYADGLQKLHHLHMSLQGII